MTDNDKLLNQYKEQLETALQGLKNCSVKAPDTETATQIYRLSALNDNQINDLYAELCKRTHVLEAYNKRCEHIYKMELDKRILIMILDIADGKFIEGFSLLYFTFWNLRQSHVDWINWNLRCFPLGYPNQKELTAFINAQKYNPVKDNTEGGQLNLIDSLALLERFRAETKESSING